MNTVSDSFVTRNSIRDINGSGRHDSRRFYALAAVDGAVAKVRTLLLVEDSAPMREVIQRILSDHFGSIHWVADGTEVLAKAADVMPDTIVLDISLPGVSGLILLPALREKHPQANIVMLTNHADDLYRRQAFARGANAYVLKSYANRDLLPAVNASFRLAAPTEYGRSVFSSGQHAAAEASVGNDALRDGIASQLRGRAHP